VNWHIQPRKHKSDSQPRAT